MGSPTVVLQPRPGTRALDDDRDLPRHRQAPSRGRRSAPAPSAPTSSCGASRSAWSPRSRRGTSRSSRRSPSSPRRCWPAAPSCSSRRRRRPLDSYLMAELLQEAGVPAGVVNIVAAGREVGEHLVAHPGIDKVAFTGLDRRRPQDRGRVRRAAQAGQPGARRQVGRDRARRRRPRRHHGGPAVHGPDEQRPGVRGADPDPRQPQRGTPRWWTRSPRPSAAMPVGDPADPATEIGPMVAQRQQERVEKYIALGQEEGARAGGRRQRHARRPRPRLVRAADGLRRRRQLDADRPGGDLRAGALGDPVRRRRRRRPDRQRLRLRPRRHRVDRRPGGRPRRRPPRPHRHLRREHLHDGLRGARSAATRPRASVASSGPRGWRSTPSSRRSTRPHRRCSHDGAPRPPAGRPSGPVGRARRRAGGRRRGRAVHLRGSARRLPAAGRRGGTRRRRPDDQRRDRDAAQPDAPGPRCVGPAADERRPVPARARARRSGRTSRTGTAPPGRRPPRGCARSCWR